MFNVTDEINQPYIRKETSPYIAEKRRKMRIKMSAKIIPIFLERGYEATTIKDIEAITGLKSGSIYNLFDGKIDILKCCISLGYEAAYQYTYKKYEEYGDILSAMTYVHGLELRISSNDRKVAELMSHIYRDNSIMNVVVNHKVKWYNELKNKFDLNFIESDVRNKIIAIQGCKGGFITEYASGERSGYADETLIITNIFNCLFEIDNRSLVPFNQIINDLKDTELIKKELHSCIEIVLKLDDIEIV